MLSVLAHHGPPSPEAALWASWNADPLVLLAVVAAGGLYLRGRRELRRRRGAHGPVLFGLGLGVAALAVVSPLDALSGALASAHMAQHLLLIAVAAPLLALSDPWSALLKGVPLALRRSAVRTLAPATALGRSALRRAPALVCLLHVGTLWAWHAAVPYELALRHGAVHAIEHVTLLATALLFWTLVVGGAGGITYGHRVLLVFAVAMPGVLLGALMTFATVPWYDVYAATAERFGLDSLADQQLAGVLMWVPGGLVYTAASVALLALWLRQAEIAGAPAERSPNPRQPFDKANART